MACRRVGSLDGPWTVADPVGLGFWAEFWAVWVRVEDLACGAAADDVDHVWRQGNPCGCDLVRVWGRDARVLDGGLLRGSSHESTGDPT